MPEVDLISQGPCFSLVNRSLLREVAAMYRVYPHLEDLMRLEVRGDLPQE
jgi:hypothetical protein